MENLFLVWKFVLSRLYPVWTLGAWVLREVVRLLQLFKVWKARFSKYGKLGGIWNLSSLLHHCNHSGAYIYQGITLQPISETIVFGSPRKVSWMLSVLKCEYNIYDCVVKIEVLILCCLFPRGPTKSRRGEWQAHDNRFCNISHHCLEHFHRCPKLRDRFWGTVATFATELCTSDFSHLLVQRKNLRSARIDNSKILKIYCFSLNFNTGEVRTVWQFWQALLINVGTKQFAKQ